MKILSGIQPSGQLHIGNYFGMMLPMIRNMEKGELYAKEARQRRRGANGGGKEARASLLNLGMFPRILLHATMLHS